MRELKIGKNDAGNRLDAFLHKTYALPSSLIYKYIRLKRVKLNGRRAEISARLNEGDVLSLYINDDLLDTKKDAASAYLRAAGKLNIAYEDQNILIVVKPAGMSVHEDESGSEDTLIAHIQAYLFQKGEWKPKEEHQFAPALANRIDRNTSGLVLAAKNEAALRELNLKIKAREIEKSYLAACIGQVKPPNGTLESYLFKDEKSKQVYVKKHRVPGAKTARMQYKTLAFADGLTLLECTLDTGRTHQIRAQLADLGFPLLGDRKYGSTEQNKRHSYPHQALCSYQVRFAFEKQGGVLDYLDGKTVKTGAPDFVARFFPATRLL